MVEFDMYAKNKDKLESPQLNFYNRLRKIRHDNCNCKVFDLQNYFKNRIN